MKDAIINQSVCEVEGSAGGGCLLRVVTAPGLRAAGLWNSTCPQESK